MRDLNEWCSAFGGVLILANRDIHEGGSESAILFGPYVTCTDGAPNSEACLSWPIVISTKGTPNSGSLFDSHVTMAFHVVQYLLF